MIVCDLSNSFWPYPKPQRGQKTGEKRRDKKEEL